MSNPFGYELNLSEEKTHRLVLLTLSIVVAYILFSYSQALFAFVSPTPDMRWETSVTNFDQPSYQGGDIVTLTGFLEEGTQYYYLMIDYYYFTSGESILYGIVVLDPNNMPVHVETGTLGDIDGDHTLDPISFTLSPTATLGNYKVRIVVWTDLLENNGLSRTKAINEGIFEVIS